MTDARPSPDREQEPGAHLAIACFAALCRNRLADRLLSFSRAAPGTTIGVEELALAELLPAARTGRVALAVAPAGTPGDEGLVSMALWREQMVVAMAAAHPLAAGGTVNLATLLEQVVLLSADHAEGEMQRYQLARLFTGERPPLDARGGRGGVLARVADGDGVALMLAGQEMPAGVVTRPIDAPDAVFAVQAWWRADHASPALAMLLRLLEA